MYQQDNDGSELLLLKNLFNSLRKVLSDLLYNKWGVQLNSCIPYIICGTVICFY